ncbi:MAG: DUF2917 domain-containing protein [Armatimonadetes bacterium]|nr:DUF2917 domain-containing protein [Akkermansiaceae bacterium]
MQTILPNSAFSRWFTGNRCQTSSVRRRELERRETFSSTFQAAGNIHCLSGLLWVTRDGDSKDILLHAGESLACYRHDRLVIEALENAILELTRN